MEVQSMFNVKWVIKLNGHSFFCRKEGLINEGLCIKDAHKMFGGY